VAGDAVTPVELGDGLTGFYYSVQCAVNGSGDIVIPAFTIQSTEDGNLPTALFTGQLFTQSGSPIQQIVFGSQNGNGWKIPILYGANVTWADLFRYNQSTTLLNPPATYPTYAQMLAEIAARAGQFLYATVARLGLVYMSVPPASASVPIAVGVNDPKVTADQAANVASIRTLGTGALQATAGNDARLSDNRAPLANAPLLETLPYSGDGSLVIGYGVALNISGNAILPGPSQTTGIIGIVASGGINTVTIAVGGKVAARVPPEVEYTKGWYAISNGSGVVVGVASYPTSGQVLGRFLSGLIPDTPLQYIDVFGSEVRGNIISSSVINVTDAPYNADKTGVTDASAGINLAIAALNLAGKGVLYFPSGIYKVASTLTTITAYGSLEGDGIFGAATVFPTAGATQINFTSGSTNAFNIASKNFLVRGIALSNTAGSTPTAGYGFNVTGSDVYQKVDFERVTVHRFYNNLHEAGGLWSVKGCVFSSPVNHHLETENAVNADAGDALIDGNWFINSGTFPPVAIKVISGGGLKITNNKILEAVQAIEADAAQTSVLIITGNSIESVKGNAVKVTGDAGTGKWANVIISNNEISIDGSNTTNNGVLLSGVNRATVSSNVFVGGGSAVSAIALGSSCSNVKLGPTALGTFGRKVQTDGTYTGEPLPDGAPSSLTISSNTIAPEYETFAVNDNGLIKTISNTSTTETFTYRIIPLQAFTYDATGNIVVPSGGGTAVVNKVMTMVCVRNGKCYPSY
jgi:hypothetical protein